MPPIEILFFVAFAMFAAGLVKGLTGLGLPAMSLGLMLLAVELKQAIVILLIPLFVTNIWQGVIGGHMREILARLWPMLVTGLLAIWFAVGVMVRTDAAILTVVLGTILFSYSAYSLATPQIRPPGRWEPLLSPLAGAISGTIGGLTGSLAVPAVLYMQALGMSRDALTVALGGRGALPTDLLIVSAGAVAPALVGMELGSRLRRRLPEHLFRRVFFGVLLLLGIYIGLRGYLQM
jgi:uncharacterized membrane protein YfcA